MLQGRDAVRYLLHCVVLTTKAVNTVDRRDVLKSMWNRRTDSWEHQVEGSEAFERIRSELMLAGDFKATDRVLDLGAGTGFITLPIALRTREVVAVDVSEKMLKVLQHKAERQGIANVTHMVMDLTELTFPDASFDVIVSSYALHHLRDDDKKRLIASCEPWLRPGGRIVIADMMFGRLASSRDRQVALGKAKRLVAKGPAGVWRLARNIVRFGLRSGTELPASPKFWLATLDSAGFREPKFVEIVAEAGMVRATVQRR